MKLRENESPLLSLLQREYRIIYKSQLSKNHKHFYDYSFFFRESKITCKQKKNMSTGELLNVEPTELKFPCKLSNGTTSSNQPHKIFFCLYI